MGNTFLNIDNGETLIFCKQKVSSSLLIGPKGKDQTNREIFLPIEFSAVELIGPKGRGQNNRETFPPID